MDLLRVDGAGSGGLRRGQQVHGLQHIRGGHDQELQPTVVGDRSHESRTPSGPGTLAPVEQPIDRFDAVFPVAASIAVDLVRRAEVADRWAGPSALAKMSVGALACHLGRQAVRAAQLLPLTDDLPLLPSVEAHYERAAWTRSTSPDDPVNDRTADDADAELGPAALVERTTAAVTAVTGQLGAGRASDVVPIPWQGWSLRRDDFLLTRMLEIVVHADDLAVSLDVPTPVLPDPVFDPVRELLARLAVSRHGQSAFVSALTRRERAGSITAF
jgi:hypothetical protein